MPCVRTQEVLVGFGKGKQTDVSTANSIGNIWRLNKLDNPVVNVQLATEDDAAEYGKSDEFASAVYKTNWNVEGSINKYMSSQFAAWAAVFGLSKTVKSGAGPYTYTCTPLNPQTDGCEPLYFSYLQQIRPAGPVLDQILIGNGVSGVTFQFNSGVGRQSSRINVNFVGTGKITDPSTLTMPAATAETLIPASSLAFTMNGTNYVSTARIENVEFGFNQNLRPRYYPGSGTQSGGALAGALEMSGRSAYLRVLARFEQGSDELTKLRAQTTGTAVISAQADANNSITATFHQISYAVADLGETDGWLTVSITASVQKHTSNGLMTLVVVTGSDGIGQ